MPRPKLRYLAVPDFRAKGVADARVAPMSIAVLRPESGEKLVPAPTLLLDTRGKEFPSEACVSVEEALRTCVPPAAHPDPRAVAAAVSFMMEEELEDLATAYDGAVVDADLALLPVPPAPRPSHDDWKNFLLGALEREDARREHRSSRVDLEPVETPIAPRRNVLDDASRVAAPTGAQLATALKKFFSRSSRGSSPSPSRSDMFAPFTSRDRHEAARASAERETRAPFGNARVERSRPSTPPTSPPPPVEIKTTKAAATKGTRRESSPSFPSSSTLSSTTRDARTARNPSRSPRAWGSNR